MVVPTRDSVPVAEVAGPQSQHALLSGLIALARRLTGDRLHLLVVVATLCAFAVSYWVAYLLRFEFSIPTTYSLFYINSLPFLLLIKLVVFYSIGIYRILWAYVGLKDLYRILLATAFASSAVAITNLLFLPLQSIPRSVLVADGLVTFLSVGGLYALLRSIREANARTEWSSRSLERVFIVGAGDAGESLLREIQRTHTSGVQVVGFIDDAQDKKGLALRGVPILGSLAEVQRLAEKSAVRKAFIAIPSAEGGVVRRIVSVLLEARVAIKILPPLTELSSGRGFAAQLRSVSVEDLLRRAPIRLDTEKLSTFIHGKRVLVTGAAGSIGSEICRQVTGFNPGMLVAVDIAETPLHALQLEFGNRIGSSQIAFELADVTDRERVSSAFERFRPDVVFHAAALKHVPLLESHPREAVRVNVGGTRIMAEAARDHKCGTFILISSDKAVRPSSVMGATKRIAELLLRLLAKFPESTKFLAVRFGNVLGSNGSVIPIFKDQLSRGGPLTVTHPEMTRYFMTIPEAVQLVLQAAVLGRGGETFMLDMGKPVKIVDLAEDFIRLSGLTPSVDVKIEFVGIRPGEKLSEELHRETETVTDTGHPLLKKLTGGASDIGPEEKELVDLSMGMGSENKLQELVDRLSKLISS